MPEKTPIYSALRAYAGEDVLRLHMPGHAGKGLKQYGGNVLTALDVTEVAGLDDLHLPRGIIRESQQLLAQAFAAGESYYLVNGATQGIQALLLALGTEGKEVLIPRNAHRSFYAGLVFSGAIPVYIPVRSEARLGLALALDASEVEGLLERHPEAVAVFAVSPSYYGTASDIAALAAVARERGKCLLVDEAHGAHFYFSELYPPGALSSGADAAVNGLHKTFPVLNQGAVLHLSAGSGLDEGRVKETLSLMATTSPSYPILASMELACRFMEDEGERRLDRAYEWSQHYRRLINETAGLGTCDEEIRDAAGVVGIDPLKLLISTEGTALTGYQLGALLRTRYRVQVEMEAPNLILAMFSLLHEVEDWKRFFKALVEIAAAYPGSGQARIRVELPPEAEMVLTPRQAFKARWRRVALREGLNRIVGEMIATYPPGIPCLYPGELISREMLDYLSYLSHMDAHIQGPEDASLRTIKVIDI